MMTSPFIIEKFERVFQKYHYMSYNYIPTTLSSDCRGLTPSRSLDSIDKFQICQKVYINKWLHRSIFLNIRPPSVSPPPFEFLCTPLHRSDLTELTAIPYICTDGQINFLQYLWWLCISIFSPQNIMNFFRMIDDNIFMYSPILMAIPLRLECDQMKKD